jgi:imidazolonepropionase-like amidohydrolase
LEEAGAVMDEAKTLFRKTRDRKIVMGIGTDAGGQYRKQYPKIYFDEMKYFVDLGASPMDAIVAATDNSGTRYHFPN